MGERMTGLQTVNIERSFPDSRSSHRMPARAKGRKGWYIRRRNQLLRRMGLLAVGTALVVTVTVKAVSAWRSSGVEEDHVQWENQDMLAQNRAGEQQMSLVGEPEKTEPVIVLDAGHGGKDPGTMANGIQEKDINLAIVKKIQTILEDQGYQVILTREEDQSRTLSERVKTAGDAKAAVFVSIHQNALEHDTKTSGIQIYCNKAVNPDSAKLTEAIHSRILDATKAKDRGNIQDSDFYVVLHNPMPSCLVETGFLTSLEEQEKLTSEEYQEKLAKAVAEGIEAYLDSI